MRRYSLFFTSAALAPALALAAFGLAEGRAPDGGKGRLGRPDPLMLLRNPQIKKELELSEEQTQKLQPAIMKALAEVLNDKQMQRFRQINLQARGNSAFDDRKVRKGLKLSEEQGKNIDVILADAGKEREQITKAAGKGKGAREKLEGLRKETRTKIMAVLTDEQQRAWQQMIGAEFHLEPSRGPRPSEKKLEK